MCQAGLMEIVLELSKGSFPFCHLCPSFLPKGGTYPQTHIMLLSRDKDLEGLLSSFHV
jgi:hypothetical protein